MHWSDISSTTATMEQNQTNREVFVKFDRNSRGGGTGGGGGGGGGGVGGSCPPKNLSGRAKVLFIPVPRFLQLY